MNRELQLNDQMALADKRVKSLLRAVSLLTALWMLALSGCRRASQQPALPLADINVVLIVVDTLGAKHLGCFGSPGGYSPVIDGLAARGINFTRAYAAAPWTKPSVSAVLTGQLPASHGVTKLNSKLSADAQTLAELYQEHGWQTAGVVSHVLLAKKHGFAQGFGSYRNVNRSKPHETITSAKVTDGALEWLQQRKTDAPFFLFLHYFDPHYNYNHFPEFDRGTPYTGPVTPGMGVRRLRELSGAFKPADVEYLQRLYHEEIAYTDQQIGRLVSYLEQQGLAERTLLVLVADHGEEFLERGWIGHTRTLHDELVHVPLIFYLPGTLRPGVVAAPVSQIDIVPTLAALSLPPQAAPARVDGISLAPWLGGAPADSERLIFSEVAFTSSGIKDAFKTSVVRGRYKLIHDRLSDSWALFDLIADPGERQDISAAQSAVRDELSQAIRRHETPPEAVRGEEVEILPEEVKKLQSLGYM